MLFLVNRLDFVISYGLFQFAASSIIRLYAKNLLQRWSLIAKNMDPAELELQIEHKKKELLQLLKIRLHVALHNKFTKEDQDLLCLLYMAQRTGTTK
jgi:hypothetical protein